MHFVYTFDFSDANAAYEAIRRELLSPARMLASAGETLLNRNTARHEAQVDPESRAWKPLAPSTRAALLAKNAARITQGSKRSGKYSSLDAAGKVLSAKRILLQHGDLLRFSYRVEGNALRLGTVDRKALWHQLGTGTHGPRGAPYVIKAKPGKALRIGDAYRRQVIHPGVPARPMVGWPDGDARALAELARDHLHAIVEGRAKAG